MDPFRMPRIPGLNEIVSLLQAQTEALSPAYEWLADKGIVEKVSSPLRLTEKSRVTVDEAAYYYDGEEHYR